MREDFEIGLGCVSCQPGEIDSADAIVRRVDMAIEHLAAERITINPDCGFNPTPRWIALPKLKAMVEGTKIVRRELGLGV